MYSHPLTSIGLIAGVDIEKNQTDLTFVKSSSDGLICSLAEKESEIISVLV
jgi:hypothetical protein